jgi:CheY-like chemotaxis protein
LVKKILGIEDDPLTVRMLTMMLKGTDYEFRSASDGLAGIKLATSEIPDLIFMDIHLPGLDGIEITRRMRAITALKDVPIVALTANVLHGDRERYEEAGFTGYMSKPITKKEVLQKLQGYLGAKQTD